MKRLLPLLLAAVATGQSQDSPRPPNIVLVVADDVGYECFGAYGSRQYRTPRIDQLADTGVLFTNCYSTPLCTPTRVALMTGMSNARNYADFGSLLPDQYTIADLFGQAGFATAVAGKWQLQGGSNAAGVPPGDGFDTYCLWNTGRTEGRRFWNPSLEQDGQILEVQDDDYGPDVITEFLLDFVEVNQSRPFFVYYPMILVHSPFVPTPHSSNRESVDEQQNFVDMVEYSDYIVGRLQDKLSDLGLLDDTVFAFTSDNGTHQKLVSEFQGGSVRGDKGAPTDAGTHVPLVVSAPGRVPGGRVLTDLIDFTDFLPTLADAAGLELPEGLSVDGVSFWDRLRGGEGNPRKYLYTYYFPRPFASRFDSPYSHPEVVYVRDTRYKLYRSGELFDLRNDPLEAHPLPATHKDFGQARRDLERALAEMPGRGMRVPADRSEASKSAPRPRWPPL